MRKSFKSLGEGEVVINNQLLVSRELFDLNWPLLGAFSLLGFYIGKQFP